ncbi:MAG: hypothetical protein ACREMP_06350 [Candidatus Tyrphobacter sp.]
MNCLRTSLSITVLCTAACAAPALAAQCTGELEPPHLVAMGTHSTPAAGNGTVRVQVRIDADGAHAVTHIISSTNHRDDRAALELASSSRYHPATCSGHPIVYFYDPVFHFSGSSVSSATGGGASGAAARVQGLIRAGDYDTAKSVAQSALANDPNDRQLNQLLGIAEFYGHDYSDAAEIFARLSPPYMYPTLVAQALATAAVVQANTDPQRAVEYAQRALSIDHSLNSRFALGVSQLGAKAYTSAIATLQNVRAAQARDPHFSAQDRYKVDEEILRAYVGAGDTTGAQPIADEMRRLEPSNQAPAAIMGEVFITQGEAALAAKNYERAIALFDKATDLGSTQLAVQAYDQQARAAQMMPHPDGVRVKGYADKALALDPNDPSANFLAGIGLALQYSAGHNRDAGLREQALTYLNKADSEAKAAGQQALATNIESVIHQLNAPARGMP